MNLLSVDAKPQALKQLEPATFTVLDEPPFFRSRGGPFLKVSVIIIGGDTKQSVDLPRGSVDLKPVQVMSTELSGCLQAFDSSRLQLTHVKDTIPCRG